jgi:hypothetical protein
MVKTDLTDEEKKRIIEALNSNTEPPPELTKRGCHPEPGVSNRCRIAVPG